MDSDSPAGLAFHQGDGPCTNRRTWPTFTWFVAGLAIGRKTAGIDLMRRPSAQCHVRPLFVVPSDHESEFPAEIALAQRDQRQTTQQHLERKDQPLDDRQAPVLADRPTYRGGVIPLRLHQRLKASQSI